jgi:FdhD protein
VRVSEPREPPFASGSRDGSNAHVRVSTVAVKGTTDFSSRDDELAVEEPLEIRVELAGASPLVAEARLSPGHPPRNRKGEKKTLSVTMRTPGDDLALAVGFAISEGFVRAPSDLARVRPCGPSTRPDGTGNVVVLELSDEASFDPARLERHFYTSSSCGVCGKTSLEAVRSASHAKVGPGPRVTAAFVHGLPLRLRAAQATFSRTGGLHAAGLFDASGELLEVREDVGRHNAVDKVIGARFLGHAFPLVDTVLLVSGRASFELVQKAVMAGVGILAAVGAPSSLAVDLAREEGLTVLGFVRDERFNVYSCPERIEGALS